jgi:hypothetical protein
MPNLSASPSERAEAGLDIPCSVRVIKHRVLGGLYLGDLHAFSQRCSSFHAVSRRAPPDQESACQSQSVRGAAVRRQSV